MELLHIIVPMATVAALSLSLTPAMITLAHRFQLVDDARTHKHPALLHVGVIPRSGGIPIFLSILIGTLLFLPLNHILIGTLIGGGMIVIVGAIDDRYDTPPWIRLIMNFVVAGMVILFGLGIPYVTSPFGGVIQLDQYAWTYQFLGEQKQFLFIANLLSLIWIVALMNFVSWSSAVDGQLSGFVGVSSVILGLLALRFTAHDISSETVALFAFIVAAAFFGFLPWHFYPQRIMPGYGGGALAGYLLAILSILSWGKIGTLMLVLAVPLVDAVYTVTRRIMAGHSPLRGDAGHFHHKLLAIGWGKRRIALFYWLVSGVFGIAALLLPSTHKVLALSIVVVLLALFIAVMNQVQRRQG